MVVCDARPSHQKRIMSGPPVISIRPNSLPFFFFSRKLQDGWFPPCLVQTLCPSCGPSSLPTHSHPFSPFNEDPLRLIGCQPIKAHRFRNPPKRKGPHSHPQSSRHTPHVQSYHLPYFLFIYFFFRVSFTCFLCGTLLYRSIFTDPHLFLFAWQPPRVLYGVLSSNKYQSWVGAQDIRRAPFPCVIVPHQFKIAVEAGSAYLCACCCCCSPSPTTTAVAEPLQTFNKTLVNIVSIFLFSSGVGEPNVLGDKLTVALIPLGNQSWSFIHNSALSWRGPW